MTSVSFNESRMVLTKAMRKKRKTMGMKRPDSAVNLRYWKTRARHTPLFFTRSGTRSGSAATTWLSLLLLPKGC